jgi:hypothetical protein
MFNMGGDDHFNLGDERVDVLHVVLQTPASEDFSKGGSTLHLSKHMNNELGVPLDNQYVEAFPNSYGET